MEPKFMFKIAFIKKYKIPFILLISAVFMVIGVIALKNSPYRRAALQLPVAQHFLHTYHSLRKISDVLFFPYLFIESDLPTYRLSINTDNIARLNESLSTDPMFSKLEEDNKIFVRANFSDSVSGYDERVKIRYRGLNSNHWNSLKKSYRVAFPDEHYFNGIRLLNFVTPYDRVYFVEPLNMYRAKKLGLIDLDMYFSRLNINGVDNGVFLTFEHWSPEFLAKKALPESSLFGVKDESNIAHEDQSFYKNYVDDEKVNNEEVSAFLELLYNSDDNTFKKLIPEILDLEKLYKWNVLTIISGSNHQDESNNTILYFNGITGKFEIIPWDLNVGEPKVRPYNDAQSVLLKRLFSFEDFKNDRDKILRDYVENEENFVDDLEFYDELFRNTKKEFFSDSYKLFSNLKFLKTVKKQRSLVVENWEEAVRFLDSPVTYEYVPETISNSFKDSFRDFLSLGYSIDKFIKQNPMFYKISNNTVGLSGTVEFRKDTAIPSGIGLSIQEGTRVFFDSEVSLSVYGPVNIAGTSGKPVIFKKLNTSKAWGTFQIRNAEDKKSTITFLYADGGSGSYINGIVSTGMISIYNSDVDISHSIFSNASDDDSLNIKGSSGVIKWSYFNDNASDALDIDFTIGDFQVTENTFKDNNGDAIDISYSNISISDNEIDICVDKGISVGEKSTPIISNNVIQNCDIGIAVKDLSYAIIENNTITDNTYGVSVYKKKEEFGGASAELSSNTFDNNVEDIIHDEFSSVEIKEQI